jgi:hypothetical protein
MEHSNYTTVYFSIHHILKSIMAKFDKIQIGSEFCLYFESVALVNIRKRSFV